MLDTTRPILDVRGLSVVADRPILDGVSLTVNPGEVHGLLGMSGSGKTTFLRAVLGQLPRELKRTAGEIWLRLDGTDPSALADWVAPDALRDGPGGPAVDLTRVPDDLMRWLLGRVIGYVPQNRLENLPPLQPVESAVIDTIRAKAPVSVSEARQLATEILDRVGLRRARHKARPRALSGGERQRVLLALLEVHDLDLSLFDEPTAALDPVAKHALLNRVRPEPGGRKAIVLVTHDVQAAIRYCDRVTVLLDGRVVESGPAKSVLRQPRHPYTRQLVGCLPESGRRPLPTLVNGPGAGAPVGGCSFYDRCPDREETCAREAPADREVVEGWRIRCSVAT